MARLTAIPARHQMLTWDQAKLRPRSSTAPATACQARQPCMALALRPVPPMAGDRRVHHTERSKWRLTLRRLAGDALAALHADDPGPAQQAVAEMVDLACGMKSYDYFHSDDPADGTGGPCLDLKAEG